MTETINMRAGSTLVRDVSVVQTTSTGTQPYDLTTSTVTADVSDKPGGNKMFDAQVEVVNPVNGQVVVSIPSMYTTGMDISVLYYCARVNDQGVITLVDDAKLVIEP